MAVFIHSVLRAELDPESDRSTAFARSFIVIARSSVLTFSSGVLFLSREIK